MKTLITLALTLCLASIAQAQKIVHQKNKSTKTYSIIRGENSGERETTEGDRVTISANGIAISPQVIDIQNNPPFRIESDAFDSEKKFQLFITCVFRVKGNAKLKFTYNKSTQKVTAMSLPSICD